jgi:hypothetical protein
VYRQQVASDYSQPFQITGPAGNNALSFDRRGPAPAIWVPSLISGTVDDVRSGDRVVFEDFDEHDVLQSCTGLAHLVRLDWDGIPAVVMDNHNHAFYFWYEARLSGRLEPGATLIHVDQHRDTRVPDRAFAGDSLEDAFDYTNFHLNVGNYVVPAQRAGMIGEMQLVTSGEALADRGLAPRTNKILNIDLDFFAPEMSYVDFSAATRFLQSHLPTTSLITIATSPFFIDQARAIGMLRDLRSALVRKT